ncbi:putative MutT/NUDIX-family protein [Agromyces luteolus]|uniref:NUDIX domain-containing protein n=1 Tax=Agromyces luteolus TaxID=88373 RepID=A0A7C9LU43_9MICO|nr:NUDIX domain-containing protein [Agromyces luteolus]MUN08136.1 NUDIX domain-containing protein [Agromyces luteolus]GLK27847.1 putative MutT/NUDIX-family protein [Agromyces luteolus]
MPTPDFVLELRRHVGTAPLPLVGVTAVILREGRVLLGRRADTGALTPITGIVDPGEEPALAAAREAHEEAGVRVRVDRLAWVHQVPRVAYGNGDRADYLDLTFRCSWLEGEPHPADGEMTDLGWHDPADLDDVDPEHRRRIESALAVGDGPTRFEVG